MKTRNPLVIMSEERRVSTAADDFFDVEQIPMQAIHGKCDLLGFPVPPGVAPILD